jgi:hypothetical protein
MMVAGLTEGLAASWSTVSATSMRTHGKEKRMLVFRLMRTVAVVVATAALGIAHTASAANFDGVGQHTLTSSNLSWTSAGLNDAGMRCTSSIFEVNVASGGATATVTNGSISGCAGTTGLFTGLPADVSASGFPWTITRTALNTFTIDGVRLVFNVTGSGNYDFTGALTGGTINCMTHVVTYTNAGDLTITATVGPPDATAPATVSGTFTDDQGTLCVT